MPTHITDRIVKALPTPATGNKITYDEDLKGFGVRVTANGSRSFVLNFHIAGRERRMTIGAYPAWTVAAARKRAGELIQDIDRGIDPLESEKRDRAAPTVAALWSWYRERYVSGMADRSQRDVASMWTKYILPKFGPTKLANLTSGDIDDLHREISTHAKVRANRVCESFRAALNKAHREGWIERNPANGFRRNKEEPKDRYLTPEDVAMVFRYLDQMPNRQAANAIRLLIFTGARRGELLNATWDQFDLDKAMWVKPSSHTKQRRTHRTPLSVEAVELLKAMKADATGDLVFPSATSDGPIPDIKRPWDRLRKETGLTDLRIHDLRHTFASLLISGGESLAVIGKLLGHSQHQTTMRYAHLMDDPLRSATNKISTIIGK